MRLAPYFACLSIFLSPASIAQTIDSVIGRIQCFSHGPLMAMCICICKVIHSSTVGLARVRTSWAGWTIPGSSPSCIRFC